MIAVRAYGMCRFCAAFIFFVGCMACLDAPAEFYVWYDDEGHKHVSNVPAPGFTGDVDVRGAYDPRSIRYQHARMLDALADQRKEIALERDNGRRRSEIELPVMHNSTIGHAPREGIMDLDELIELEKRGGRLPGGTEAH